MRSEGGGRLERVEALIRGVLGEPGVVLTVGGAAGIAELMGVPAIRRDGGWLALEAESWHLHLNLAAIVEARFETGPSAESAGGTDYSIAFVGADGEAVFRAYFTEMENADGTPREERIARFWALRDAHGSGGAVRFAAADS